MSLSGQSVWSDASAGARACSSSMAADSTPNSAFYSSAHIRLPRVILSRTGGAGRFYEPVVAAEEGAQVLKAVLSHLTPDFGLVARVVCREGLDGQSQQLIATGQAT